MMGPSSKPLVAIACGGTGGHLFPGIAVGLELRQRGCEILLLTSPKEVDRQVSRHCRDMDFAELPAVGLARGNVVRFLAGFWKSYWAVKKLFHDRVPQAVLAMGGFTSAPPVLAGKSCGAATFLHESNSIPGRANRWLGRFVNQAYVGFPSAIKRLPCRNTVNTGTPVRPEFKNLTLDDSRKAMGLDPERSVLLIMGGSQGARAINRLMIEAMPQVKRAMPDLQILHVTGTLDEAEVKAAYARQKCPAWIRAFVPEMHWALGAATVAVSRAGASSLAELAATRLPSVLIPYPSAADDHQYFNAKAWADSGAGLLQVQLDTTSPILAVQLVDLLRNRNKRTAMQQALAQWDSPHAAQRIADHIMSQLPAIDATSPLAATPEKESHFPIRNEESVRA